MLEKLLARFSVYLRNNEIRVPTSILEETMKLIPHIDICDRFEFKESIRQLWVKDVFENKRFDQCFQEFFFEQISDLLWEIEQKKQEEKKKQKRSEVEEKIKKKLQEIEQLGEKKSSKQWLKDKLVPKLNGAAKLLERALEHDVKGILDQLNKGKTPTASEIKELAESLVWDAILDNQPKMVFDTLKQTQNFVESLREDLLKVKNLSKESEYSPEKKLFKGMRKVVKTEIDHLKERNMASLKPNEISELAGYIQTMSEQFLTKMSRVLRVTKQSEELDMAKMMRKSMETFGVPIHLMYQKPKVNKTKIDIILDVSGSVIKSAQLLSLFAYLIFRRYPGQVRSFVFVGMLAEVTEFYHVDDVDMAIDYSLRKAPIDYKGYSNYDQALSEYEETYMDDVDKDTIILFLGDARNNRNDARIETVQKMQDLAKYVFWLNPEEKEKWDQGDSVIGKYAAVCNQVFEVTSLKKLEKTLYDLEDYMIMH